MRLLLDTHTWIWWAQGEAQRFSPQRIAQMQMAEKDKTLMLCAISLWEVAMLESKQRIDLGSDCSAWLDEALVKTHVTLMPMRAAIAVDSTRLPDDFHPDPSDRIIVATARAEDATLLTSDGKILEYSELGHVRTLRLT